MSLVERTESEGRARPPRALGIYDRIADPMAAVKQLGRSIAMSKMFGEVGIEQGEILALECLARKMPPLTIAETYHVIFGRLAMRADAILAKFNEAGGRHRIISRTGERAEVELSINGQTLVSVLTWEEAQAEPFVYVGLEAAIVETLAKKQKPKLKSKYATPRGRMQMLWARVVSDGVRALLPGVVSGRYTPEEMGDDEPAEVTGEELVDADFEIVTEQVAEPQPAQAQAAEPVAVVPAAVVQVGGIAEPATPADDPIVEAAKAIVACTGEQSTQIRDTFAELGMSDVQVAAVLAKRNCNVIRNLSYAQAEELLSGLQIKLEQHRAQPKPPPAVDNGSEAPTAGQRANSGPAKPHPPQSTTGPCTPEQEATIRAALKELEQSKPGSVGKFGEAIKAAGFPKIAALPYGTAEKLIVSLGAKQLEQFLAESLQPKQADAAKETAAKN